MLGLGICLDEVSRNWAVPGPRGREFRTLENRFVLIQFEYISQEDDVRALLALWKPL